MCCTALLYCEEKQEYNQIIHQFPVMLQIASGDFCIDCPLSIFDSGYCRVYVQCRSIILTLRAKFKLLVDLIIFYYPGKMPV